MAKRILVLHGPNLNLFGEGTLQGSGTLSELNERLRARARELGAEVKLVQSNHEGALIDALHAERRWADGVLICPAGLSQSGFALRDALVILGIGAIEIRIDGHKGDKGASIFGEVCSSTVFGKPMSAYLEALDRLCGGGPRTATPATKTIGRKKSDPVSAKKAASTEPRAEGRGKTIGPARKSAATPARTVTRALVRDQIAACLNGSLSAGALAAWAREKWLAVERGETEAGRREQLEEALQQLAVSSTGSARMTDDDLVALMARLD
jgi:3-dehydroquinate dehydratase II